MNVLLKIKRIIAKHYNLILICVSGVLLLTLTITFLLFNSDTKAEKLLTKMTLAEKIGQMMLVSWKNSSSEGYFIPEDITTYHLGALLGGGGAHPPNGNNYTAWANLADDFQKIASNGRLGIPLLIGNDAVHGVANVKDATVFPHHIGLGATGDAELVEEIARITAIEASALGINWNYSPAVSVPQDLRWGRTYEGFSSDTDLVSNLGAAEVRGLQSISNMIATPKHFIADGGTYLGDDRGNADISEADLRSIHLPPYQLAIEAGARVIMISYNSWKGEKLHGHSNLIQGLLKGDLGFSGLVVSDWDAIKELGGGSLEEDLAAAVNAGIDMIMVPYQYKEHIKALHNLVSEGVVTMDRIDDAVRRILRIKFEFGLFEDNLAKRDLISQIRSEKHLAVAREAVSKSIVLLTNKNNALPLSKKASQPILVVGPSADNMGIQCGGWTIRWQGDSGDITAGDTVLEALRAELGVNAVKHVETLSELQSLSKNTFSSVIIVWGEDPYAEWHGDGDSSSYPYLPNNATFTKLVKVAAEQFDVPIITLIISGRPVILDSDVLKNTDAIAALWLPGSEGRGISDVLVGKINFTGRLPYVWPLNEDGLTTNAESGILFPREHGLSY